MFVYNDLLFGPRFRRDILPRIHNPVLGGFCMSCCGMESDEFYDNQQLVVNSDEDNEEP
jgi:hypothetical protein